MIQPRPTLARLTSRRAPEGRQAPARRAVVLGAPPWWVKAGVPGARDAVRAYAGRVAQAYEDFWALDVQPWTAGKSADGLSPSERQWLDRATEHLVAARSYIAAIESFDLLGGDSPGTAWERLEVHEDNLRADRASFPGGALKSKIPNKTLEDPGGQDGGNPIDSVTGGKSDIPWNGILAVGGLLAGAWALSSVAKVVG